MESKVKPTSKIIKDLRSCLTHDVGAPGEYPIETFAREAADRLEEIMKLWLEIDLVEYFDELADKGEVG
jgi:hypothetical protein